MANHTQLWVLQGKSYLARDHESNQGARVHHGVFCLGKRRSLTAVVSCLKGDISGMHSGRTGRREVIIGNEKKKSSS